MKTTLILLLLLGICGWLWLHATDNNQRGRSTIAQPQLAPATKKIPPPAKAAVTVSTPQGEGPGSASLARAPQNSAAAETYFDRLATRDRLRLDAERLNELGDAEARALAQSMLREIDARREEKVISNIEASWLKLHIMRKVLPAEEFASWSQSLLDEQASLAEENRLAWKNRDDANFREYKKREQEVLREVMQMDSYPQGLTRNQYLRQRLDQLRKQIYSVDPGAH